MKLVKLDAINSTNTYLKQLAKEKETVNWTVVTAEFQTYGRGQMETKWESEKGKNLMCSVLIRLKDFNIKNHFYLNCAISLGIYNALQHFDLPQLKIKWPNDIMSVNKKIGGILIENSLMNDQIYQSIVGIGLNVNQEIFSKRLPKAISMWQLLHKDLDRDTILRHIITSVKEQINLLEQKDFTLLHQNYEQGLFKKDKVHMFADKTGQQFVGKILGVSDQGLLQMEMEEGSIREFNFKEVIFL